MDSIPQQRKEDEFAQRTSIRRSVVTTFPLCIMRPEALCLQFAEILSRLFYELHHHHEKTEKLAKRTPGHTTLTKQMGGRGGEKHLPWVAGSLCYFTREQKKKNQTGSR
ncbi:PR domain zinc finger protein 8 [Platysternon megacephalum]|uniref:PR domain zinc finger protein 8 n=1 Tax=Platysternon megacephalum TaxID=55544 RepID=A0A4D9E5Y4_9SAUR|nr:PR domain zinc finger protein 8 [Platysternon megacephalum]